MNKINTASRIILFVLAQFCTLNFAIAQNNCLKIGQNVTGIQFKDVFKENIGWRFPGTSPAAVCSGIFGAPGCPEQPIIDALPKDANGYVTGGIPYNVSGLQTSINNTYSGSITSITTYMQRETFAPYALGDYYVFWQGQGTMRFFWNDGPGMIRITAGSYGTIPVANGYELNFGVSTTGIAGISVTQVTSDASAGVHYCRITVPATTGTPAKDPFNNTAGIGMQITSSAVAPNHLRGISVVAPDFGSNPGGYNGSSKFIADGTNARTFVNSGPEHFKTQPFHPAFLNWIKIFPVFRFKDAIGVDQETPKDVSWLNVRPYDYYTQTAQIPGVGHPYAYMYMIQLCNLLKKDAWINGFVNSDENYQRNLGKLFKDNLDPNLKVYLELSNENTWNFFQGFNGPGLISNYAQSNSMDFFDAASFLENRFWVNFGSSWKGEDQDRMVRVVGGQAVNGYHCARKTQYHEARNERYDVLSVAWYLDQVQDNAALIPQNGTPLQLLNAMIADNNFNRNQNSSVNPNGNIFPSIAKVMQMHVGMARAKGKKLALYEGGTHHSYEQRVNGVGVDRANWDRSKFIKWLPEIRTFYRSLIDTLRNFPEVELAMAFNLYGGSGEALSNGQIVEAHNFGFVPNAFSDTTATGDKSFTSTQFGNINIFGTNAHGVWKELNAQNNVWKFNSICTPTITSDIVGSGLSLNFVSTRNQYVNVTGASLFDPLATTNYTIETWIKPAELERQQAVWAYSNGSNVLNALNITALNKLEWNIGNGSTVLTGPLVERDKWYHVAVVKNGTSVQMYVNGTVAASGSASGSAGVPTNYTLGASNAGSLANYFRGGLDEHRVWSGVALSQPTIRDYMCKKIIPATPNYASLSTYIEFNSISGTNLMDRKTALSHGTLVNFVATESYGYLPSGAPIGDLSTNVYPGSWANSGLSYTNPVGGDIINVNGIGAGNPDGVHIYVVNQAPTLNTKPQFYTSIAGKYFGVFLANGTNPSYNVNYNFQGNASASATVGFNRLVKRDGGSDYAWDNSGARIDPLNKTLITNCTENYRAEYILGVRQNQLIQRPGSGTCISLPGTSVGTFLSFKRSNVYTLSFWAKGVGDGVMGFRDPFTERYINYRATNSADFVARYQDLSLGNQNKISGGENTSWTHYAYTRDASGLFVYYVNGYPSSSIDFPGDTSMVDMFIKAGGPWAGQFDELSVWKRNLSLTEIRDLMCKKITPSHPSYCDLQAYFKFDEGSGNVMENTLGAGNIVFDGPIAWVRSGAAIGDESKHNYNAPFIASIAHPDGDFIKVTPTVQNGMVGTQVYIVNSDPNYPIFPSTETYPGGIPNRDTSRYFGTYVIPFYPIANNDNQRSYLYEYNYAGNKNINFTNEANLRLIRRETNQVLNWTNTGINPVIDSKTLTWQSPIRLEPHHPVGEFLLAGTNPSPFIAPLNGIPTLAGITGKSTLCLGESNALYKVLAPVDKRALSFKWIASNGLSLSNSTADTVNVTALTAGAQTLTVIGINKFGTSTPFIYPINVQNTGYLSSNITGNLNPCNSATATYSVSNVSPSPIAYLWSVTGDAINPTPSNLTPSNAFNFGGGGQSIVRISVYGQYSCGLALINTLNVNNNSLPTTTLGILGDSLCLIDNSTTIAIKVNNSQNGVTYTAFDGATPVATTTGNGGTLLLNVPAGILTTFVNKVITVKAQNNLCPLIPVNMATTANILMGNTLTGGQLAPTFANPGNICYDLNTGDIKDFPLVITSGAVSGTSYTPNYLTFAQPYGEPFESVMGRSVIATGTSVTMLAKPSSFPFWLSFGVPNSISGFAKAPGCPTQKLTTKTTFTLNNTPGVAVPSKVAGPGKDQKMDGDGKYPVCTGTPTSHFTTAKGGSISQFNQRYFNGAMTNGSANITMSSYSNMTSAQIDINDVVYILGTQTDGSGLPAGNNLPQLDGNGNKTPYFVVAVNSGANTIQLATSRGGGAITMNFNATNIKFWAPITIDIPAGTNTFNIPNRFGTLGLGLYSQINFIYASQAPGGVCVGYSGGQCHPTQYVASFSGSDFQISANQMQGGDKSAGYFINRGRITYTAGNPNVTGFATIFQTEQLGDISALGGAILRDLNNNVIGEVQSVTNEGALVLKAGAIGNGTNVAFSSSKRIWFSSIGESVVLSAPQDTDPNGVEWTVGPKDAIVSVTSVYGGGTYNPATGVFSGGNSDAVKNGITITWNGTFSGVATIGVTSSKSTPCFAKSNPQGLPSTPGYEQTNITLDMLGQIPSPPLPIGFTELSFCQSQSNTNFVTNSKSAVGGYQWQLQNAGTSNVVASGGTCGWSKVSNVVGDKGFNDAFGTLGLGGGYWAENTSPCLNSTPLGGSPSPNNNTAEVSWQPGFTGLATIRVRTLGCGSMSNAGDMRASPWVTAVITIGGAPNPGNINLAGQLQLCQGASPTQQYIATGTNIDQFKYFLRKPGTNTDIGLGLLAYYPFNNNLNNQAFGTFSLGAAVNGTSSNSTFQQNKNAVTNSAIEFDSNNDAVDLTFNSAFVLSSDVSNGGSGIVPMNKSLTFSMWTRFDASGGNSQNLFSFGPNTNWEHYGFNIKGTNTSDMRLAFYGKIRYGQWASYITGGNPGFLNTSLSGVLNPGTWYHISANIQRQGTGFLISGYVNGVLSGTYFFTDSQSALGYGFGDNGEPLGKLIIGKNGNDGSRAGNALIGRIDEFMIHNRPLTNPEILELYNQDAALYTDPSDYIGEINGNTGLCAWQTTFSGAAQIGVQAIGCGGSSIRLYDAFISPKPSILGVSIADPSGCGNPLASGSVTITLASFNPSTFTGSPWAVSWNNDLISDGTATLSGNNTITLNTGLFAGSSVTGVTAWYNGSNGCNAPISITSKIIIGTSPPSSLIGTSLMGASQVCTASTSSGINVLGSENNVRYYAMIGSMVVSPTVVGTGGNIQLSITGNNILTSSGANVVYQVKTIATSPGCPTVTLTGIQNITVNSQSVGGNVIVSGTNPICSPATSVVSVGGFNGTIDWIGSNNGGASYASTGGTTNTFTTPSLSVTNIYRAIITNGGCPSVTASGLAIVTVNSPVTTTFAYNQPAYCNNLTTVVSPVLSNTVSGGAFTVAPAGLTLNGTTGAATINSSTANLYTITYSYTVPGCPALTTTTSMRIGSIPGLAFGFIPTVFCTSSGNQTPGTTFSGLGSGGTFSSTSAGLVFANASTGQVNIAGSTAGTYPLIYTVSVAGCGNVTSTVGNAITINSVTGAGISYTGTPYCNNVASANVVAVNTVSGGIYTSAPAGLTINSITGLVTPTSSTQGTYTITYNYTISGCGAQTTTTSLRINSVPGILFNYGTLAYCKNGTNPSANTTIGGSGGTFTSAPAGLSFTNATLGTVDLTASTANTYNITYTVSVAGCGNVTSTVGNAITINSLTGTSISYTGTPYCNNVATANVVAINTVSGGIYTSAPAGLTINSTNGTITPTSSTQGTYTVTYSYTIPGCGAQTTTTSLRINSVPGLLFGFTGSPYCNIGTATPTTSGFSGGVFSSASSSLVFTNSVTGIVNLASSTAGTYPLTYTVSVPGCGNISSTVGNALTINSVPGVNISYISPVCNTATISGVTAINTVSGGIYSATGGLTINPTNGTVNPSGFGGTYTITYSYTVAGCGPQSTTTSLVVTTLPSTPTLSYGASPYCSSNSPISLVSSTNTLNGSFFKTSTTTGFSVNATTGQITIPQNTLAGVFVVRYDIPAGAGCASVTGNNTITLSGVPNVLTITNIPATQCYNAQVVLNATGTIPGASIQWLQNNSLILGATSAVYTTTGLTNPSNTFVAVLNNGVCTTVASAPMVVNVNVNPTVTGISSSQSFACSSQSVTFNNTGLVGSIVYAVNTGAGFNVLPSNIYTFTNTIVGNAFSFVGYAFVAGCQTVPSAPIIVNSSLCGLTAAFTSNPTPICLTNASSTGVTFTNTSSSAGGTILGYVWNFGANATPASTVIGINSTSYTINVTYSAAGPKTITLSILGTGGLTSTISGSVQVDALSTISAMSIPVTAICETNTSSVVSVTALGSIQWYKAGVAQGTAGLQAAGAMTSNTTFIATAVNGVCPMVTATGVVTVTNLNIGGGISGASALCASSSGLNLTVTSQVGNSYTWYNSTNSGTTWNTLSSNVNTIATGTLSTTTSYVVSVTGGACPNVASGVVTINVTPTPIAGTSSVDRMIVCTSDGNGGIYTLASSSGTIQWERSLDLSSWANAAGAGNTTASLTANVETIIGPKYFRARVTNGGSCGDVYSNVITVTASSCGLQAAFTPILTTVCVSVGNTVRFTDASTSTNTILGYTWDFAGGTGGNVNTAGPHDISFGTAGPKNIRLTILGLGGLTSIRTGTVNVDETSVRGGIDSNPTGLSYCHSTTGILTLTGFTGNSIQWRLNGLNILNATTTSLNTGLLEILTDSYDAVVQSGVCPAVTTIGFTPSVFAQSVAPLVSAPASVCRNLFASLTTSGPETLSLRQWQEWNGTTFVNIPNATLAGFTTSNLLNTVSGTYQYRLEAKNGTNACFPAYSNVVTVDAVNCPFAVNATVNGVYLPTSFSLENTTGSGVTFGVEIVSGTVTSYNWAFTGGNVTNSIASTQLVSFANAGIYPINLTVIGVGGFSSIINTTITVDAMSERGSITGLNPICYNTNDVLTLSGFVGNAIQWYNSLGIIAGANAATYTTPNLSANETYFATVRNGVSPMVTAVGITVNVLQQATSTGVNIPATLCIGSNASITATGILGTVTGWESSTNNSSWSSTALTGNPTTLVSLTDPVVYYRPLITNGIGCTPVGGNSVLIDAIGCTAIVSFTGHPLITECISTASVTGYLIEDKTNSVAPILGWAWNLDGGVAQFGNSSSLPGIVRWNTSGTKQIILTITIAGGNIFTSAITIGGFTLDALPLAGNISTASNQLCAGTTFDLASVNTSATGIVWQRATDLAFTSPTPVTTTTSIPSPTGTSSDYFYRLSATNGVCTEISNSNVLTITSTLQPSASISYTLDNCKGNPGMANVTVTVSTLTGGFFPYTFSSSTLNNTMLDANSGLINMTNAIAGNHIVTLTSAAFKGCNAFSTTAVVNVNQYPTATISALSPNSYCNNFLGNISVSATKSGFATAGTFISIPNLGISTNSVTGTFTPNGKTPQGYIVYYELAPAFGCPANTSAGITFTVTSSPIVSALSYTNGSSYCNVGTAVNLVVSANTGGFYSLSRGATTITSTSENFNINGIAEGDYNMSYTIPATGTCEAVTSITPISYSIKDNSFGNPTLRYLSNTYCASNGAATDVPNVFPAGGRFTSNLPNAIDINGQIDFARIPVSVVTNVNVTYIYSFAGVGCTSVQTITSLSFNKLEVPTPGSLFYNVSAAEKGLNGGVCNNANTSLLKSAGFTFTGGTFTINSTNPSQVINTSTGTIDLGRIGVGEYQVTYTVPANGACTSSSIITSFPLITITSSRFTDIVSNKNAGNQMCAYNNVVDGNKFALTGVVPGSSISWSLSNNDGGTYNPLPETTAQIINQTFAGAGQYAIKAAVRNNQCDVYDFPTHRFTVDVEPIGGTAKTIIPMDTLMCYFPLGTEVTLDGYRGNSFTWEYIYTKANYSENSSGLADYTFDAPITIEEPTQVLKPILSTRVFEKDNDYKSSMRYRAKVTNGACLLDRSDKPVYSSYVLIRKCQKSPFIPNALEPGAGNTENTIWNIRMLRLPETAEIKVYNRYGVEVYMMTGKDLQTKDFNGDGLPAGTYYYVIDKKDGRPFIGDLTIVR
ncbi:MAG: hypothetical protein EAZ27_05035 [Cytophagales bacterium]|nr:MAG: hypothetical protein EAZ27_05035 [Cytophagales bacterium]